jgi:hypothetical protein
LRERHVLIEGRRGRGNALEFEPNDVDVVCAIEAAKSDRDYRRKFHRAVLIAYGGGANPAHGGLQTAYEDFFRDEQAKQERLRRGGRIRKDDDEDRERATLPPELRETFLVGDSASITDAAQSALPLVQRTQEIAQEIVNVARDQVEQPGYDAKLREQFYEIELENLEDPYLGMARVSTDGTTAPIALPKFHKVIEQFQLALFSETATTAHRADMDSIRDALLELRTATLPNDASEYDVAMHSALLRLFPIASDLEAAITVPVILHMHRLQQTSVPGTDGHRPGD